MKYFILFLSFLCLAVNAKNDLSNFKIISAEILNYQDGDSVLIGNVEIQYGKYHFKAPKVFVDSDKGKPLTARFVNGVTLSSDSLDISSPIMEVDITNSLFKCLSNDEATVETRIYDKGQTEPIILSSWYQEFNIDTGFAKATGKELIKNDGYEKNLNRIKFRTKNLDIDSDTVEMQSNKDSIDYIDFIGDVIAKDDTQRTESVQLFYFPDQDLIKAQGDVKILYLNETEPSYIFSDLVIYERKKSVFSAMSTLPQSRAEVHAKDTRGKARQIILTMNDDNKPERAILTGNAFAQYGDKSLLGHEILLNIQDKTIETIVGRPRTQILKSSK